MKSNSLKVAFGGSRFNLNLLFKAKIASIPLEDRFVNVGVKLPSAVMLLPRYVNSKTLLSEKSSESRKQ